MFVNVPTFGDFGHHLQIFVEDYIPNSWVMFNLDIYQPLFNSTSIENDAEMSGRFGSPFVYKMMGDVLKSHGGTRNHPK